MDVKLFGGAGVINSLLVSTMGDIPEGNFNLGIPFLIKNNTYEDVQVTIIPAGSNKAITTTMYIGWNPELVKEVIDAPVGLLYGY